MDNWNWATYSVIKDLYTEDFPLEVRILLESFLCRKDGFLCWNINSPTVLERELIHTFIVSLKDELEEQFQNLSDVGMQNAYFKEVVLRPQYERVMKHTNDIGFIQLIKYSLTEERKRLEQLNKTTNPFTSSAAAMETALATQENRLEVAKQKIDTGLKNFEKLFHNMQNSLQTLISQTTVLYRSGISAGSEYERIQQEITILDSMMGGAIDSLAETQKLIIDELDVFIDKQRFTPVAIRAEHVDSQPVSSTFNDFELWFKSLVNCIYLVANGLPTFTELCKYLNVNASLRVDQVYTLLTTTIQRSGVFEQQPRQITRQNTFFPLKFRVLAPVDVVRPELLLVNKAGASKVINQTFPVESCGSLIIDTEVEEKKGKAKKIKPSFTPSKNVIRFPKVKAIKVKRRKRDEHNGENVVGERFWIYFKVDVNMSWLGQSELFHVHTLSQPMAITTHPVQDAQAWTHIVWVNACPINLRINSGLDPPEQIEWKWLIEVIDEEFVKLGRSLSNDKKMFLRDKLFRDNVPADEMVNKEQFCGRSFASMLSTASTADDDIADASSPTPSTSSAMSASTTTQPKETQISYGEWLFHCINLLNPNTKSGDKTLGGIWAAGKILGFVSREQVVNTLSRCPNQKETFIIRFPEKWPGHIGLYFYKENDTSEKLIKFCYTMRDLHRMSLEDRIIDSPIAKKLYSDFQVEPNANVVDRDIAFPKAEASAVERIDDYGYVHNITTKIKQVFSRQFLDVFKTPSGNQSS